MDNTAEYIQQGQVIAALAIMSFSFFAGWSIGFAIKVLFKVMLFIFGAIIASIIALQYAEIIPAIDWIRVEVLFRSAVGAATEGSANLFNFAKQAVPGTAAFIAGAWMSWRKH